MPGRTNSHGGVDVDVMVPASTTGGGDRDSFGSVHSTGSNGSTGSGGGNSQRRRGSTGMGGAPSAASAAAAGAAGIMKRGWLRKCGHMVKSWKKRYFVLDGTRGEVSYYEKALDFPPYGEGLKGAYS